MCTSWARAVGLLTLSAAIPAFVPGSRAAPPPPAKESADGKSSPAAPKGKSATPRELPPWVIFAQVMVNILPRKYYDPKQLRPREAFWAAVGRLERSVPEVVAGLPAPDGAVTIRVKGKVRRFNTADLATWRAMGDRLFEILKFLAAELPGRTMRRALQHAALKGVVGTLDPYSAFLTPEEARRTRENLSGSLVGIGVVIGSGPKGGIVIREVVSGGPANRAGLKPGDLLVSVDDLSMQDLTPDIAVRRLRGKLGTTVKVVVARPGRATPIRRTIERRRIVTPTVKARMLRGRVALLAISDFRANTAELFAKALTELERKRPRGYVLDLRSNHGGYVMQAVRIAGHFLKPALLVQAVARDPRESLSYSIPKRRPRVRRPVVVLVDPETASASEILAGPLAAEGRAVLIGAPTWGKGTVQKLHRLPDGSALKMTRWQYLLQGRIPVQATSILPDFELVPVRLEAGAMRLITAGKARREAQRARHIATMRQASPWQGRPVVAPVKYLAGHGDPVLELARRVLTKARSPTRRRVLSAARPIVRAFVSEQRRKILARLASLGIDWQKKVESTGAPTLTATLEVIGRPREVAAGGTFGLALTVRNAGKIVAERVNAVLQSYSGAIDGREMLVGRVAPGSARTVKLSVSLPRSQWERMERIRARVQARNLSRPLTVETKIWIRELPRPRFRFQWLIDDRTSGNGDGVLDAGEAADLLIFVSNDGKGEATALRADATLPEHMTVLRARTLFPPLRPGATALGRLRVRGSARSSAAPSLTVTVYDKELRASLEQRVRLPRAAGLAPFSAAKRVVEPRGSAIRLSAWAGPDAPRVARVSRETRLAVEAERGSWLRVALPGSRFAFVERGDVAASSGAPSDRGVAPEATAAAPHISVRDFPREVSAGAAVIRGKVRARQGVRDLWVRVWNPERKGQADKLAYVPAMRGGALELPFETTVPLQPGTNYIVVDARDMVGASGQTRLSIHRPYGSSGKGTFAPATTPTTRAKPRAKKTRRSGCGCAAGAGEEGATGLLLVLGLLSILGWRRRRQMVGRVQSVLQSSSSRPIPPLWFSRLQPGGRSLGSSPQSHSSPTWGSMIPLPQVSSERQSAEQPSPEKLLPSSHCSPTSRTAFPHSGRPLSSPPSRP